jgi:4-hydroxymandelate oxidase
MTPEDVRNEARKKLKGICGVYRDCDGLPNRICQGQSYGGALGIGGIGAGYSFSNNVKALAGIHLKMKLISSHFVPDTSTTIFGKKVSMPVYGAPVTGVNSFGGEDVITEEEFCRSTVLGCRDAGSIGWRGDTFTYTLENPYGLNAIKEAGGWGIKICKPRDQETLKQFIKIAEKVNAIAVGVDVDGCGSFAMAAHDKPVYRKTIAEIKDLSDSTGLPFIVKGVMCVEDAEAAAGAGADAVVVSNHGGRVLDHTPGTAEVLPDIIAALKGMILILVDGGVRTGYDVLKMLALGADGVLVGRDILRAAVGGGIEGVRVQMDYLKKTLGKAMLMTGCQSINDISKDVLI